MKRDVGGEYTSSLLAHFVGWATRDRSDHEETDYGTLARILGGGCLSSRAANALHYRCNEGSVGLMVNRNVAFTSDSLFVQSCVCFCDIPHGALGVHVSKYGKFGLAFEKHFLVPKGASPAFYVATDSLGIVDKARGEYFNERIRDYFALKDLVEGNRERLRSGSPTREIVERFENVVSFLDFTVLGLLKPFDSGLPDADRQNVYMEREWRILGDVSFELADVAAVYGPANYVEKIEREFPDLVGKVRPA